MAKVFIGIMGLLFISLLLRLNHFSRENNVVQLAIETVRIQTDLPDDVEVKFVEKRDSAIPDFYAVKLLVVKTNQEFPVVVYVDRDANKVIVGSLFVRGENITLKEAGGPGIPKIDAGHFKIEKSRI